MSYKHIFFDLDHTLWDFNANSGETLLEIYDHFRLSEMKITNPDMFINTYSAINDQMWDEYRNGKIKKQALRTGRFHKLLRAFEVDDHELAYAIGKYYVDKGPYKTNLLPGCLEVLKWLKNKYSLHIITNGFEQTQHIKLQNSGLFPFFDQVITSERAKSKKPHARIFQYSLEMCGTNPEACLMVGDNLWIDILGAKNAGIDQVYFNPGKVVHNEKVTFEINSLPQLKKLL